MLIIWPHHAWSTLTCRSDWRACCHTSTSPPQAHLQLSSSNLCHMGQISYQSFFVFGMWKTYFYLDLHPMAITHECQSSNQAWFFVSSRFMNYSLLKRMKTLKKRYLAKLEKKWLHEMKWKSILLTNKHTNTDENITSWALNTLSWACFSARTSVRTFRSLKSFNESTTGLQWDAGGAVLGVRCRPHVGTPPDRTQVVSRPLLEGCTYLFNPSWRN